MHSLPEWLPVSIAPFDRDLEVCVLDYDGIVHALVFPYHKDGAQWVDASNIRQATFSRRIGAHGPRASKRRSRRA